MHKEAEAAVTLHDLGWGNAGFGRGNRLPDDKHPADCHSDVLGDAVMCYSISDGGWLVARVRIAQVPVPIEVHSVTNALCASNLPY